MTKGEIKEAARACGFELVGVAAAVPAEDRARYHAWTEAGFAGRMGYLADHRAQIRDDPRNLLPTAKSIICVGKLYNTPHTTGVPVSRYARGEDYHLVMRRALETLDARLREAAGAGYESKICVDTAPLLERSYARLAGLGWIGRNTSLIHEGAGSWFFLGELLTSLDIAPDAPAADRCGSCRRCIDACPTQALVPAPNGGWRLDSRRCISYLTIELRGPVEEDLRPGIGGNLFGCDICQEVCPWNRRAPETADPAFAPHPFPELEQLPALKEAGFKAQFGDTPLSRARYNGLLRNAAIVMGNSGDPRYCATLNTLAEWSEPVVADAARWALTRLRQP